MDNAPEPLEHPTSVYLLNDSGYIIYAKQLHGTAVQWESLKWESIKMKNMGCTNPSPWETEPARRLRHNLTRNNTKYPTHGYLIQLLQRGIKEESKIKTRCLYRSPNPSDGILRMRPEERGQSAQIHHVRA